MMDDDLLDAVSTAIEDCPEHFADAVDGVDGAKNYLVGRVLQETGGSAHPTEATKAVEQFIAEAGPSTYVLPYTDRYMLDEKVNELDIPDTEDAADAFRYPPNVELEVVYERGSRGTRLDVTGVEIDNTMYDIEPRES